MTPEVLALAEAQAAQDRDTLARLVRAGAVTRAGKATALTRDIEARLRPKINLAIRSKRKNGRR